MSQLYLCTVCSYTVVDLDSYIFLLFLLNLSLRPYFMNFPTINPELTGQLLSKAVAY